MTEQTAVCQLRTLLLDWFDAHKRDLPWRHTDDPYRIWVSEIMLQQTQVDRVITYYDRFLNAFPTVQTLAEAPLEAVLKLWEGLGYYSRARNLHRAAGIILNEHGGRFPRTMDEARALPGVGAYAAGAILSIACGERVPAIDANVKRVLARLFCIEGDPERGQARAQIARLATDAVPEDRPGEFNQALMELGALICVARTPGCLLCPVAEVCLARQQGIQARIPPPRRSVTIYQQAIAALVERDGKYLLARRPSKGVWGGLWEFPNRVTESIPDHKSALKELLCRDFGLEARVVEVLTRLRYGIMDRQVELSAYVCVYQAGEAAATDHTQVRWLSPAELSEPAMPSPHRAVAEILSETLRRL